MTDSTPIAAPISAVLEEYDRKADLNSAFVSEMQRLVSDLLLAGGTPIQAVTSRLKTRASLAEKLGRGDCRSLDDVTDLCGIRITTYFSDDVDRVAQAIEREFEIDRANSIDKRAALDADRFGYVSVHYIARLPGHRLALTENKRFEGCCAEIQIRSVLQHVWAEIEHDLGYKSKLSVPRGLRRQFSRLAGLLEIADHEFMEIRDGLREYETHVAEQLSREPASIGIDQPSLTAFIAHNALLQRVDSALASGVGAPLIDEPKALNFGRLLNWLAAAGLTNIGELQAALEAGAPRLVKFRPFHPLSIPRGFSLYALAGLLALDGGGKAGLQAFLDRVQSGGAEREPLVDRIYEGYAAERALNAPESEGPA
ncbi:MAG: GTP pyrophosphokinase family protein [Bryobacteraceae bacterium]